LDEIEHALDNLETQNDNIHSKLKELLESNREIRKEMANLGMSKSSENENQQLKNLNINNIESNKASNSNISSSKQTK
jgi:hypothetical protein